MKRGLVLMLAIGIVLSHEAHGAIEVGNVTREDCGEPEKVVVRCAHAEDDIVAVVTEGLVLRVTHAGEVVHEQDAEARTIEAGPVYYRTGYRTGSVLDGGADLRVITEHTKNPEVAGHAHLTMRLDGKMVNALLRCSIF